MNVFKRAAGYSGGNFNSWPQANSTEGQTLAVCGKFANFPECEFPAHFKLTL
jgi:hypothetical protein